MYRLGKISNLDPILKNWLKMVPRDPFSDPFLSDLHLVIPSEPLRSGPKMLRTDDGRTDDGRTDDGPTTDEKIGRKKFGRKNSDEKKSDEKKNWGQGTGGRHGRCGGKARVINGNS